LCFSCDRIFHQRCANVVDADLSDNKAPWICHDCLRDPLNAHATQFFKSGRYKLFLKDRLEKFTTENDLPSPVREKDKEESDREYLDSFFDISEIEKSLHVRFGDLEPIQISRLLVTNLINQQEEFESIKQHFLKSEQEKIELRNQLVKKMRKVNYLPPKLNNE